MNPSFLANSSLQGIRLDSKLKAMSHGDDVASIKAPAFVIPNYGGTISSMQKILTPMKLPLNRTNETLSNPIATLPQGIHILPSPSLFPPVPVSPLISSSPSSSSSSANLPPSTPQKLLPPNGRPPGLALCLSKDNARQLFLCLLQQQQQQNINSSANFLNNHVHQEKVRYQLQPQDTVLTSPRCNRKSQNLKLLSPTKLKSSNHEKVVLMQSDARNPFQQIISVHPKQTDLSKTSSVGSSNALPPPIIPPIIANPSKINGIIKRRPLIRSDTSLEKLRVSSQCIHKATILKSGNEQSTQSNVEPIADETEDLLKIFHNPLSRELLLASSSSSSSSNVSPQKPSSVVAGRKNSAQRKLGIVKPMKSDAQIAEKTCSQKYVHKSNILRTKNKRTCAIITAIRPTNQLLKHDRSRISRDRNADISKVADLPCSSDELDLRPFHRRWWNAAASEMVDVDEEETLNPDSSFTRIRKYGRLLGKETKRLRSLRRSFNIYEMMVEGETNLMDKLKPHCSGDLERSIKILRGEQDSKIFSVAIGRRSKKINAPDLRVCLHQEGDEFPCSHLALPYTNHCIRHIMYSVDQQLYTYCTAKCPNNVQCCCPVLNSGPPICSKHLHGDTNRNLRTDIPDLGPFSAEPKRKCQAAILKRVKKKKLSNEEMDGRSENGKEFISSHCEPASTKKAPAFDCLTGSLDQGLLSADDLSNFELMPEVPFNFTKESLDEVLSSDFLREIDPFFDTSNCFMDTPDVHDVFGKLPVEVFDFGTIS